MADNKKSAGGTAIPSAENKKNISISIIEQAKEKIKTSVRAKLTNKAKVVEGATAAALKQFCDQSEEFSRAVIDCDEPFENCLNEISRGIGNSISDFDLFSKAVQFYFPGAVVEFRMLIHMSKYELDEPEQLPSPKPIKQPKDNINLSLDSLLDW